MKQLFCTFILISIFTASKSQTKNFIDQPYIEVKGQADTSIVPNEIFIKIIIAEKDTRDRVSIEEMEARMVDSLKSLKIDTEKDLATRDMASNFRFYFLKKKDVMKTKEYILKVSDAVTATRVFMRLEDMEISNSSIERVNHTALELFSNSVRSKAIRKAQEKAISLTSPLGQALGPAIFITDNESPEFMANGLAGNVTGLNIRIRASSSLSYDKYDLPKIEFEKIKITSQVMVRFILK